MPKPVKDDRGSDEKDENELAFDLVQHVTEQKFPTDDTTRIVNLSLHLSDRLQDTSHAIAKLERALAEHPESTILRLNLESISKRFDRLQTEFKELARLDELR